jgi:hypothetical protein
MELIKDNYLSGSGSGDTWHVKIDPPKSPIVGSYFEETVKSTEYVYANKTGKIHVLFSGGLDSEFVARVLLHLKMDFEIVIINLQDSQGKQYNNHDTSYAFDFCKQYNIKPIVYDLNFDNFVTSGKLLEIANSIECCAVEMPATVHVASQIDGFTLMGNDPPYLRHDMKSDRWYLEELQCIHSTLRFYDRNKISGCPFLLSYSAEQMLSFLLDPAIVKLGNNLLPWKGGSNSTKSYVFNNGSGFDMRVYDFSQHATSKLSGYELIHQSKISQHPDFKIFEELKKKWNGAYLEYYPDAVTRLSCNP